MTADVPVLGLRDVQDELRAIHRRPHRTLTTAIFGKLGPGTVAADAPDVELDLASGKARFLVRSACCELELREALLATARDPVVVLLDWIPERIPADIAGRIANGAVYRTSPQRRLGQLFGTETASPALLACRPLVRALLEEQDPRFRNATGHVSNSNSRGGRCSCSGRATRSTRRSRRPACWST